MSIRNLKSRGSYSLSELLDEMLNEVSNLLARMDGAEERVARLENAKVELKDDVARLVKLATEHPPTLQVNFASPNDHNNTPETRRRK